MRPVCHLFEVLAAPVGDQFFPEFSAGEGSDCILEFGSVVGKDGDCLRGWGASLSLGQQRTRVVRQAGSPLGPLSRVGEPTLIVLAMSHESGITL